MAEYKKWAERYEEITRFKKTGRDFRWIHAIIGKNKENGKMVIRLKSFGNWFSISKEALPAVNNLLNQAASSLGWVNQTQDAIQNIVLETEELRKIKRLNSEQTLKLKGRVKELTETKQSLLQALETLNPQNWRNDLEELGGLLDDRNTKEKTIQDWLFEHTWIFGPYYIETEKEVINRDNDRVDFLLKRYDTYYDVIELKLPSASLFDNVDSEIHSPSRENPISKDVKDAISQVIKYLEEYELDKAAKLYTTGKLIHKPKAMIVISRRTSQISKALKTLNSHLNDVEIFTYDDMLEIGKNQITMFEKARRPKIKK